LQARSGTPTSDGTTFAVPYVHTGAMPDPSGTDAAQPQPGGPEDSQQADSVTSRGIDVADVADLVGIYDDEQLESQSQAGDPSGSRGGLNISST
jgi:hypothetical protein